MEGDLMKRTVLLQARNGMDKVTTTIYSTAMFLLGLATLTGVSPPPPSLYDTLAGVAYTTWSILLVLGAPLALYGRWKDKIDVEAIGYFAMSVACLTYGASIMATRFPNGIIIASVILTLCAGYAYRGYTLNRLSRELKRIDRSSSL